MAASRRSTCRSSAKHLKNLMGVGQVAPLTRAAIIAMVALTACAPADQSNRSTEPGTRATAISPSGKPVQARSAGYDPWPNPVAESTPSGAELAFVSSLLAGLNRTSFAQNTEICGYMGRDPQGNLFTTLNAPGLEAECILPTPPANMTLLASYHTHGTYSPEYDSEFPTTTDMESDRAANIDGYISTPGGRLWHVDSDTMTVTELCGVGCLPMDPGYRPDEAGRITTHYTYAGLQQHERG
jgi:hypothetical protein